MEQEPKKENKNKSGDDFNWNRVFKIVLGWGAILVAFFLIMIYTKSSDGDGVQISFDQYQKFMNEKKIDYAVIKKSDNNYEFFGKLKSAESITINNKSVTVDKFNLYLPYTNLDENILRVWNDNIRTYSVEKQEVGWLGPFLSTLPWILIIVVWIIFMRRMLSLLRDILLNKYASHQ